jgi:hypothetical protein
MRGAGEREITFASGGPLEALRLLLAAMGRSLERRPVSVHLWDLPPQPGIDLDLVGDDNEKIPDAPLLQAALYPGDDLFDPADLRPGTGGEILAKERSPIVLEFLVRFPAHQASAPLNLFLGRLSQKSL